MLNTINHNIPAIVAKAEGVQVVKQYRKLSDPHRVAQIFSIELATSKGYSNTIVATRRGFRVICDETQMAVDFWRN